MHSSRTSRARLPRRRWHRWLLFAASCLSLLLSLCLPCTADAPTFLPAGMPTTLRIGWLGPVSTRKLDGTPNVDSVALGQPSLVAFLAAVKEANASPDWLPFTEIEP